MHSACHQAKRDAFAAPILGFSQIFHIHRTSPISRVRIAAPVVLAQHKRNERIGKVRTPICSASPIVIELTLISLYGRETEIRSIRDDGKLKDQKMPSATVTGQYPTIYTILDPP
jgi:hypothetical protein